MAKSKDTRYKGLKLRIYPNKTQQAQINMTFNHCRFVWNQMLAMQSVRHENGGKYVGKYDMQLLLKTLKNEHKWLKDSDSMALQSVCSNLDVAFQRLFKHLGGYPKFKSKKLFAQSYTTNSVGTNIDIKSDRYLKLPKIGWLRCQRNIKCTDKIKSATIKRNSAGQYFAVLILEFIPEKLKQSKNKKGIKIEMWVDDLITLSNGVKYKTTKNEDKYRHKLNIWEHKLARCIYNSKIKAEMEKHELQKQGKIEKAHSWWEYPKYKNTKKTVAKLRMKISNVKNNRLHEITTDLVKKYDVIKIKDLKFNNMMENHHLSKDINNQSWSTLRIMLEYKCDWYGKDLKVIYSRKNS